MPDAAEVIEGDATILITCEHATQRMPNGWSWPDEDRWLVGTHWAYDIGARFLTLELAERTGAAAVLSRFSRMVVDANRPEDSPTLFRERAEGRQVHLNTTHLTPTDRERRIETLLRPFHRTLDACVRDSGARTLVAMHTFTPIYEGKSRDFEVGVLYDLDEDLAARLGDSLVAGGVSAVLNQPYSGKDGLMYSVDRHARQHERASVELEVRQDLAVDPEFRSHLLGLVAEFFRHEDRRTPR